MNGVISTWFVVVQIFAVRPIEEKLVQNSHRNWHYWSEAESDEYVTSIRDMCFITSESLSGVRDA
jgi:hypothetical protein